MSQNLLCGIYQTYILEKCMSIRLLAHITDVRSPLHFTLHSQILRITLHKESEYMPESCQSYHSGMCSHFINMRDQRVVGERRWTLGKIDSKKCRVLYCVYFLVKSSSYLCKILVIHFIKKAFMEKHAWKENNNFSNQLFVIITSHYNDDDKKLIFKLSVILFSCMFFINVF